LLFHFLSRLYERASVAITTNLGFSDWATVFGVAETTTALLDRLSRHRRVPETGSYSLRFNTGSAKTNKPTMQTTRNLTAN
jgi:DNA replication protein DnaC